MEGKADDPTAGKDAGGQEGKKGKGKFMDPKKAHERLQNLLKKPGNTHCADCQAFKPTWASTNLSVFLCTACSGVHRSLGVHVSFVQSVTLDLKWKKEWVDNLVGNDKANAIYEYHVPAETFYKPVADEPREYREAYIKAKYVERKFGKGADEKRPRHPPVPGRPLRERKECSRNMELGETTKSLGMIEFSGTVFVSLKRGTDLAARDFGGSSDPYVRMKLGKQKVQSKTVATSLNPEWKETLILCWTGKPKDCLEIAVWDEDLLFDDDILGTVCVNLDGFPSGKAVSLLLPLSETNRTVSWEECSFDSKEGSEKLRKQLGSKIKKRTKGICDMWAHCFGADSVTGTVEVELEYNPIE